MAYKMYDVCNDMTLESRDGYPDDLLECTICCADHFWKGVSFAKDEEEGPLYFLGVEGLDGKELD